MRAPASTRMMTVRRGRDDEAAWEAPLTTRSWAGWRSRLRAPLGAGGTTCLGGTPRRDRAGDSSSSSGAHQCAFPVS